MTLNAKPLLWMLQHPLIHSVLFVAIFVQNAIRKNLLVQDLWAVFLNTLPIAYAFLVLSALIAISARYEHSMFQVKHFWTPRPTMSDLEKSSVHEAGHLIGLALFPNPPKRISMRVNTKSKWVSYTSELRTINDLKACIKMLLASTCAEQIVLKKTCLGNDNDLEQCEAVARRYLQCFAGLDESAAYPWFRKPEGEVEAKINAKSIHDLIADLRSETFQFVKKNETLLRETTDHIRCNFNQELKNDWCQAILKKVVL